MIPGVNVQKQDFQTGVTPTDDDILAIISTSSAGVANVPSGFNDTIAMQADDGDGPLTELSCFQLVEAKKPVLAIKGSPTTPGAFGSVTLTGAGTATFAAKSGLHPYDSYLVIIKFLNAGALGTAGIQWQYSVDGGQNFSAIQVQGTGLDFIIPNSGVGFTGSASAATVLAGQTLSCPTTAPVMSNADIATSLEALRVSKASWDMAMIDGAADQSLISSTDTWLANLEENGVFKAVAFCTRARAQDGSETEGQFATAMQTAYASASTIRGFVGADHCDKVSVSPNWAGSVIPRPSTISICSRLMSTTEEIDPAQVNLGPLPNTQIDDANQNPKWHDEAVYPGLDPLRLATLRTFQGAQAPSGVFVNNCPALSPTGSDYVYIQHVRVMNKACTIAYALLLTRLSIGVRQDPDTGFILERDALEIEQSIQAQLQSKMGGQVSGITFKLARNDDLSSNAGATINCTLSIASLKYIKTFKVKAKFASQ